MEKQPKKSAAAGGDLISNLPDEILHSILRRIPCAKEAAQTSALSRRWGNLWRSYPKAEFASLYRSGGGSSSFWKFSAATIKRFSRDKQLRMESIKISLYTKKDEILPLAVGDGFPAFEQLLDLASKRKAEHVDLVVVGFYVVCLPLELLSNSSAKTVHFVGISWIRRNGEETETVRSQARENQAFGMDRIGGDRDQCCSTFREIPA